jgi:excisionase family DNA binding protein
MAKQTTKHAEKASDRPAEHVNLQRSSAVLTEARLRKYFGMALWDRPTTIRILAGLDPVRTLRVDTPVDLTASLRVPIFNAFVEWAVADVPTLAPVAEALDTLVRRESLKVNRDTTRDPRLPEAWEVRPGDVVRTYRRWREMFPACPPWFLEVAAERWPQRRVSVTASSAVDASRKAEGYSIKESARLLGVSEDTIQRKCKDGTLTPIRLGHRTVRILRSDLQKLRAPSREK